MQWGDIFVAAIRFQNFQWLQIRDFRCWHFDLLSVFPVHFSPILSIDRLKVRRNNTFVHWAHIVERLWLRDKVLQVTSSFEPWAISNRSNCLSRFQLKIKLYLKSNCNSVQLRVHFCNNLFITRTDQNARTKWKENCEQMYYIMSAKDQTCSCFWPGAIAWGNTRTNVFCFLKWR